MARNTRIEKPKTFPHYLELPSEVRKVINEEMNPDDMCRFTRTSKLCKEEVQKSRKYIYGLTFEELSEEIVEITVNHARSAHQHKYKYQVEFRVDSGEKYMKYSIKSCNSWTKLWSIDLDRSADLVQLASDYFKKLVEFYQNTIQLLCIDGERNIDFEIRSLNKLKILNLSTSVGNIMEVISRRRCPLEYFSYDGEMDNRTPETDEFIYRVQDHLYMPELKLNIDQVRRLAARSVMIHIGTLTPIDVFNLITDWKNGELRENLTGFQWELNNSNFDAQQLWQLLQVVPDDPEWCMFKIDHSLEAGRYAMLHYMNYRNQLERLDFRVSSQHN